MLERDIQRKILEALRRHGGWWVKYHNDGRYAQCGVPDIIGCYNGQFVALEVKQPGRRPTQLQQTMIEQIKTVGGGYACVVTSVDEALQIVTLMEGDHDGKEGRRGGSGKTALGAKPGR